MNLSFEQTGTLNLAQIAKNLWRSGQPTDWGWAAEAGIKRSVKLNTDPENAPTNIDVQPWPITTVEQIIGPVRPQLDGALSCIDPKIPTLIHCTEGVNRTGTLVIYWRIRFCGWAKADAIAEANQFYHGLNNWDMSLPALRAFVMAL